LTLYRPLSWPADLTAIARLDTSFSTDAVLSVVRNGRDFRLVEVPALREKRYTLPAADLAGEGCTAVVAEDLDGIAGVAVVRHEEWNRSAVLAHLYVHRPRRGSGLGAGLLGQARLLAEALEVRCLRVETQTINLPAVRFYERHGFVLCGIDTGLYDPDESGDEIALLLSLAL